MTDLDTEREERAMIVTIPHYGDDDEDVIFENVAAFVSGGTLQGHRVCRDGQPDEFISGDLEVVVTPMSRAGEIVQRRGRLPDRPPAEVGHTNGPEVGTAGPRGGQR